MGQYQDKPEICTFCHQALPDPLDPKEIDVGSFWICPHCDGPHPAAVAGRDPVPHGGKIYFVREGEAFVPPEPLKVKKPGEAGLPRDGKDRLVAGLFDDLVDPPSPEV